MLMCIFAYPCWSGYLWHLCDLQAHNQLAVPASRRDTLREDMATGWMASTLVALVVGGVLGLPLTLGSAVAVGVACEWRWGSVACGWRQG